MDQAQQRLVVVGLISPDASFKELLQQAPAGSGDCGHRGDRHAVGIRRRHLRPGQHPAADVLPAGRIAGRSSTCSCACFPRGERTRVSEVSELVGVKISAWLGGQMLLGLIIGTHVGHRLLLSWACRISSCSPLIAGIGEMIPMVGPLLSAIPAVAVALTVSPGLALGVAGLLLRAAAAREQRARAEGHGPDGRPERRHRDHRRSPIGSELLGFVGALLAVPTAAIIQVLFEELYLAEKDPA